MLTSGPVCLASYKGVVNVQHFAMDDWTKIFYLLHTKTNRRVSSDSFIGRLFDGLFTIVSCGTNSRNYDPSIATTIAFQDGCRISINVILTQFVDSRRVYECPSELRFVVTGVHEGAETQGNVPMFISELVCLILNTYFKECACLCRAVPHTCEVTSRVSTCQAFCVQNTLHKLVYGLQTKEGITMLHSDDANTRCTIAPKTFGNETKVDLPFTIGHSGTIVCTAKELSLTQFNKICNKLHSEFWPEEELEPHEETSVIAVANALSVVRARAAMMPPVALCLLRPKIRVRKLAQTVKKPEFKPPVSPKKRAKAPIESEPELPAFLDEEDEEIIHNASATASSTPVPDTPVDPADTLLDGLTDEKTNFMQFEYSNDCNDVFLGSSLDDVSSPFLESSNTDACDDIDWNF